MDNTVKVICHLKRMIYYNSDSNFGIMSMRLDKQMEGAPVMEPFTMKGTTSRLMEKMQYIASLREIEDKKYGKQYEIISIRPAFDLSENNPTNQKKYLEQLFTPGQVELMYDGIENPFKALKEKDFAKLVQIKGCGIKTAQMWVQRFADSYDVMKLLTELAEYEMTPNMINKVKEYFSDVDIAIQKIRENPYCLMEISGVGWVRCDQIALRGGLELNSPQRIKYFIYSYLKDRAEEGYSYIPIDYTGKQILLNKGKNYAFMDLMSAVVKYCGESTTDEAILEALENLKEKLWLSDDRKFIGLKYYYDLEQKIAIELLRIKNAEVTIPDNWEEKIHRQEEEIGFTYTDEQYHAMELALENNVVVITGLAGTGKSSVVKAILKILSGRKYAQTSLAGRAAARMTEITGEEGFTIHRLLGYMKGGFLYNAGNKLPQDVIILDEISMVDGKLFYSLIQSIREGAKLIMLGDIGQLESIGCLNIAADMLSSAEIPSVELTKIHRQAAKSAIITESHKVRRNTPIIPRGWTGTEVRGELQDLILDCYSDASNTYYKVIQHFQKHYAEIKNIMDVQILLPVKGTQSGTAAVNAAVQSIYNPKTTTKKEIPTVDEAGVPGVLREGDKVINTENNYSAYVYNGKWYCDQDEDEVETTEIFNGSLGVITKINPKAKEIIVDFTGIGQVLIVGSDIVKLKLGYAISFHKFQGSQAKRVVLGIDFSSYALLTKELIYTGMTRAIEKCDIVAQTNALLKAIGTNGVSNKLTHLTDILNEIAHPQFTF